MTALVTGASSGIGRDIARRLAEMGVRVVISGRDEGSLRELRREIGPRQVRVIPADLSRREECCRLYREASDYGVNILVNCAGFGLYGEFRVTELERELKMIDVDVVATHILTKLFLRDFSARDKGYILNVASVAGFFPGPLMSTYYASKNYVVRLTEAIREELRCQDSHVYVGVFCPGPVSTNFNSTAGVNFSLRSISSEYAAACAVRGMFERKGIILPTPDVKLAVLGARFLPDPLIAMITKFFQDRKK